MERKYNRGRTYSSRRSILRSAGLGGLGLAGAALLGCGDDTDPTPVNGSPATTTEPTSGNSGEARQGGSFGIATGIPSENFNPVTNWHEGNYGSGVHVYDRLLSSRLGDPGYALEAAESIELPDDVTVVFTLKDGLVYQDREPANGRPVVAEDIVTMQEYARDEPNAQDNSFQQHFLDYAEAPDERTVIYHLQHPSAYLFSGTQLGHAVTQCIVPKELTLGDFSQHEPVGSGPYQFKSAQLQVRYEYERNPTYREADQGLPYIDERVWLPIATDPAANEAAFRSEQSHLLQPPEPEMGERLIEDLGDQIEVLEFTTLMMNWRNMSRARDIFDDIRIREAFYRLHNPEPYIDLAASGWGVEPPGGISAGLEDYQLDWSQAEEYKYFDLDEARSLLDAAGFDFDRTYELTTTTSGLNQTHAQVQENQLREVGITNIRQNVLPFADWAPAVANTGEYDFCVVFYTALDTPATPIRLHHSQPNNINSWVGIRDPEIDVMIEESERIVDREEQVQKVKDIQFELLQRYSHMSMFYTPIGHELRYRYLMDWDESTSQAWPVHTNYQTQAWVDR